MPMVVNGRLFSNREPLGKMTNEELLAYEKALTKFMVSNSPMVATTLKQVIQEIEWRASDAAHSHKQARAGNLGKGSH